MKKLDNVSNEELLKMMEAEGVNAIDVEEDIEDEGDTELYYSIGGNGIDPMYLSEGYAIYPDGIIREA